jgi:beta-lactamase regulating signal transducer with metallopeptidase domain
MANYWLEQLGGTLVQSLWQGAILGAVLMVLLVFIRQPRVRYALSCLTLLAMVVWFIVSWVQVSSPSVTSYALENKYNPSEQSTPSTSMPTETPASSPNLNSNQLSQPEPQDAQQLSVRSAENSETRAFFPKLRLQNFLPYISIVWMLGVALLSLRLLVSFYLLKRYRKGSFELTDPWLLERVQVLAKRLNLRQTITLLQTNALAIPAVMGVLKPLVLLPSSLVSGLSVGQLELILAHELAHIKRCDYLVNILQTLAETLLFYHPVVWWVSKTIRQEREHCCDNIALQLTGQSALEYADVLLRLEKSRHSLALAASSGSLLRRVERLLNPARASADVRSGIIAFTFVVALSLTLVVNAVTAQPIQVSKVPYVFNAGIAVDPVNPERIAITVNSAEQYNCEYDVCNFHPLLYTSNNAGKSFQEQLPFGDKIGNSYAYPTFDSTGNLYTSATFDLEDEWFTTQTYISQASPDMIIQGNEPPLNDDRIYDSKLFADEETQTLYLSYVELQEVESDMWSGSPKFRTSTDGGKTWSNPVNVLKKPTWEMNGGRALMTSILLGEGDELAVIWFQEDYVFVDKEGHYTYTEPTPSAPYSIWVASSSDGGKTFLSPKQIGESWGMIATAYANGVYYIATRYASYETGEVSLILLHSKNNGLSWVTANINRNIKLYSSFPYEVAPGLSVTPDGTVDVVFYGQTNAPECISIPAPLSRQWTDKCSYNVYYTSSKDNGTNLRVFSDPQPLNDEPISGSQFVKLGGITTPGWFLGMASTNKAAYPVWIGNLEGVEGTQAYMMKIER